MTEEPQNYRVLRESARFLSELLKRKINYLEIGVCEGLSAKAVMETGCVSFCVLNDTWGDDFGGSGRGSPAHVVTALGDQARKAVIITGDSKSVVRSIWADFDLIFIDGDHSTVGCIEDLNNCMPLLSTDGRMIVDDINHPQHTYIKGIVENFCEDNSMSWEHLDDVHFGVSILRFNK